MFYLFQPPDWREWFMPLRWLMRVRRWWREGFERWCSTSRRPLRKAAERWRAFAPGEPAGCRCPQTTTGQHFPKPTSLSERKEQDR